MSEKGEKSSGEKGTGERNMRQIGMSEVGSGEIDVAEKDKWKGFWETGLCESMEELDIWEMGVGEYRGKVCKGK